MTTKTYIVRLDVTSEAEQFISPAVIEWLFKNMGIAWNIKAEEVVESHKVYDGLWGDEPF